MRRMSDASIVARRRRIMDKRAAEVGTLNAVDAYRLGYERGRKAGVNSGLRIARAMRQEMVKMQQFYERKEQRWKNGQR